MLKLSKKIGALLLSSSLMLSAGISQSKAEWVAVGNNINKSKIVNSQKRHWCWAYAGEKMLNCLGVNEKQASHVALAAGHNLGSDNYEDMSVTALAVQKLLPDNHPLKNAKVYNFCRKSESGVEGFFSVCSGILAEIIGVIDIDKEKCVLPNGQYARVEGVGLDSNFSELVFLKSCLSDQKPVLARIEEGCQSRIVLITGIDYKKIENLESYSDLLSIFSNKGISKFLRNQMSELSHSYVIDKVRYWSSDRGEVEEDYSKVFSTKVKSYSALLL